MKAPPPDPQSSILIGWCVILLLALPFAGVTAWHVAGKVAALSWQKTSAQVIDSGLYRTSKPAMWCVRLKYRYQVGSRTYESNRVASSWVAGVGCDREKRVIEARLERMQAGQGITVRHDPRDSASAVVYLAPALEWIDGFVGIVAAVWLGCGIAAIRTGKRQRREQDAARAGRPQPALR